MCVDMETLLDQFQHVPSFLEAIEEAGGPREDAVKKVGGSCVYGFPLSSLREARGIGDGQKVTGLRRSCKLKLRFCCLHMITCCILGWGCEEAEEM